MSSKKALREATTFLRQFDGLLKLEAEIEELGSIENLIAQRKREVETLDAQVAGIAERLQAAKAEADKHVADGEVAAKAKIRKAEHEAAAIIAQVQADAKRAVDAAVDAALGEARGKAEAIVREAEAFKREAGVAAQALRDEARKDAKAVADEALAKLAEINGKVRASEAVLTGINREIAERERRLVEIKGEIANTLAKYAV